MVLGSSDRAPLSRLQFGLAVNSCAHRNLRESRVVLLEHTGARARGSKWFTGGVVAAPRGRIQFDFILEGIRYRPSEGRRRALREYHSDCDEEHSDQLV